MCISVIYHGYAVATLRWKVELAFCAVYTLTTRVTWAVFPYTIVVLCWHGLATRFGALLEGNEDIGKLIFYHVMYIYILTITIHS